MLGFHLFKILFSIHHYNHYPSMHCSRTAPHHGATTPMMALTGKPYAEKHNNRHFNQTGHSQFIKPQTTVNVNTLFL